MSQNTNCEYCGGTITTVKTVLSFKNMALGTVSAPDIEQHVINNLPVSDFISLNQAADLLGISKQAFSKHPRVKRGFIYSTTIDNKKFFYKRSVEAFRDTKDGRVEIDGCVLLQLISDTPAVAINNFRTIMNRDNAIQLIDNLAKSLNYYPTAEADSTGGPSSAKKTKAQ